MAIRDSAVTPKRSFHRFFMFSYISFSPFFSYSEAKIHNYYVKFFGPLIAAQCARPRYLSGIVPIKRGQVDKKRKKRRKNESMKGPI